jgi:hypothetical protein
MKQALSYLLAIGLLLTMSVFGAMAAEDQFTSGGVTYTLRTNTGDGECLEVFHLGNFVSVSCADGDVSAYASVATGCGAITLSGQCEAATNPAPNATTQCTCGGVSYTVTTGDGFGICNPSGSGGTRTVDCSSTVGSVTNTASCSCANGCGTTSGTGCCCQAGPSCGCKSQ